MNVKRIVRVMLIFTFVFLNFQGMVNTKATYAASSLASNVNILEITDSGVSDLTGLTSTEKLKVTTMSMKKFVANRKQIEGLYDIIYIGTGTYATGAVSGKNHNTTSILNDITNLKADEIINNFINKNYLVILHNDVFKGTKLNSKFSTYTNNTNVRVVTNPNSAINLMRDYTPDKPILKITSYTNGETYNAGNTFTLNYDVTSASSNINLKLYLDENYNNINESSEVVATKSSKSGNISYTFPKGLSGIRNWTLEAIDSSGKKDIESGYIKFNDEKVIVNVLQVTKSGTIGSLLNTANMKQEYLNGTNYQIKIEVVNMDTFNTSKYKEINGKYDMILFGFADVYGGTSLTNAAKVELNKFIATNQSVMFTHDMLFSSSPTWSGYAGAFGQKSPYTDLGNGAPNTTTSTQKINEGIMTMYPFVLGDNITIATTHNQYYTLDLEDPNVIPWYNLIGSNRDIYDSYNHYYSYSKGNLTYSGTGHTPSAFPDSEQKLFVNTMYRAFLGANHSPTINLVSPKSTDIVTANKRVFVEALIQDLDPGDSNIDVKIYIEDKEVYSGNVTAGTTIKNTYDNYTVVGDKVTVKIVATDSRGAQGIETIDLTFKDINVPTGLDLTDASDTGVSNTDNITSDNTPTITGDAEANSTVTLYNGTIGTGIGTGKADANGKFSITTNALTPDGVYNITAKAKDIYGNESLASSPLIITIDKTAPSAPTGLDLIDSSDTGASNTDNITSDNTPTINGKAEPGSTVTLYNGSTRLNTGITDANGDFSITISSELADAVYTITADAKDIAGNISPKSTGLTITITSIVKAPTDLDLAADSDTGLSNTDNITSDNTPTINGKATSESAVTLYDKGGNLIGTGIATVDDNFSITITDAYKLKDGVNSITAKSKDLAGNISGVSVELSITIDTVAPATPTLKANITTQAKENVSITITYPNDANVKEYKIGISGKWLNYTGAVVVDTNDTIYAKCKDLAGNISGQGSLEIKNIDKTKIKTGLFVNNKFTQIVGGINIVKGFNANLAFEIKDLENQEITLNMNSTNFITISEVKVYSITDLRTPIKTLDIIGNTFTIKGLPMDKTDYVIVLKATARNLGTNISDSIKINGFQRIEKHVINVVKLPALQ
ncbi:DUF5057 domain-containing protein [Clostridium sp.]